MLLLMPPALFDREVKGELEVKRGEDWRGYGNSATARDSRWKKCGSIPIL